MSPTPDYHMSIIVYNSAGEVVRLVTRTGAYDIINDFTVENTTFSPDDGGTAIITVGGYVYEWDGMNNQGAPVQNGVYYIKVEIKDEYGYSHIVVKDVTVLTNNIIAELRIYNSAGEIIKVIPVNGLAEAGSNELKINPESPQAFSPGDPENRYAYITYNGNTYQWDGTNELGRIVNNGLYTIKMVVKDEKAYMSVAEAQIMVLHNGYEVVNNVKIIPNPFNPLAGNMIKIRYNAMATAKVTVKIYNIAGELVKQLAGGNGDAEIIWYMDESRGRVSAGVYVLVIYAETQEGMYGRVIEKLTVIYR